MIDKILLFPYWLTLKVRHKLYDSGLRKIYKPEVPSICIGNITVGGTGKTPHTEMIIRTLIEDDYWYRKNIAVLSRGYKRRTKGFQQVITEGTALDYGDEPLQMKKKFPMVTVAVDKSRADGSRFLTNPKSLPDSKKGRKCIHQNFEKADLIIFDDAFQHRAVKADLSIIMINYNRPIFKDHLMPLGKLRDLKERVSAGEMIIVSKCPRYMEESEQMEWAAQLGFMEYDPVTRKGIRKDGREQHLFFTTIEYDTPQPIFNEGDPRYLYAHRLILFSGIADDEPFMHYLSGTYKIVKHFNFPDHHSFSRADILSIRDAADQFPTSVIMTTEKDCQRVRDSKAVPGSLKSRLFYTPIKTTFLNEGDRILFNSLLLDYLK